MYVTQGIPSTWSGATRHHPEQYLPADATRGEPYNGSWIKGDDAIFVRDQAGPVMSCSLAGTGRLRGPPRKARTQAHRE
jgi:hypothetical protein